MTNIIENFRFFENFNKYAIFVDYFYNVCDDQILNKNCVKEFENSRSNFIYHVLSITNMIVTIFFNINNQILILNFKPNVIVLDEIFRVNKFNM